MADTKISDLTELTAAASDDELAIVDTDGGATKKITTANLSSSIHSNWTLLRAYHNGEAQAIANETWTDVTFDTENFDVLNEFASSTFTASVTGYYLVTAAVQYTTVFTAATLVGIAIYVDGNYYANQMTMVGNNSANNWGPAVTGFVYCAATKTITIRTAQYSGDSAALRSGNIYSTWVSIARVR